MESTRVKREKSTCSVISISDDDEQLVLETPQSPSAEVSSSSSEEEKVVIDLTKDNELYDADESSEGAIMEGGYTGGIDAQTQTNWSMDCFQKVLKKRELASRVLDEEIDRLEATLKNKRIKEEEQIKINEKEEEKEELPLQLLMPIQTTGRVVGPPYVVRQKILVYGQLYYNIFDKYLYDITVLADPKGLVERNEDGEDIKREVEVEIFIQGTHFSVTRRFVGYCMRVHIQYGGREILFDMTQFYKLKFIRKLASWGRNRTPITKKLIRDYLVRKNNRFFDIE